MSAQYFYIVLEIVLSLAFGVFALDVNNGVCLYRKLERPGDVKLVIIAGIRGEGENGVCGTPSRTIFEHVVALDWVLSVLNGSRSAGGDPYIPRVTIGKCVFLLPTLHVIRSMSAIFLVLTFR